MGGDNEAWADQEQGNGGGSRGEAKRSEIYTYEAAWHIYAMNWSVRRDKKYRLAIASLLEQVPNRVEVVQLDEASGDIAPVLAFDHQYPPTKTMFIPDPNAVRPDLLATSADHLRIWRIASPDDDDGPPANASSGSVRCNGTAQPQQQPAVELRCELNGNRNSDFCGPLTSFDWNDADPRRIGTSSIDTTCTIWDVEREAVDTQLIAHDKEVYDIAWGGAGVFASVSADGSVRVFDLRDKEHSTIIYESGSGGGGGGSNSGTGDGGAASPAPLVRLGWNKQDPRYMATIIMDSPKVVVLDIRYPTQPVVELHRHHAPVNAIAWAPHSSCHICTAGDDSQALIWDLSSMGTGSNSGGNGNGNAAPAAAAAAESGLDPILAYTAGAEIEQLQWSATQPDWVAIAFANKLQILRV